MPLLNAARQKNMRPDQTALLVVHPNNAFLRHPHEGGKRNDLVVSMKEILANSRRQDRVILHFIDGGFKTSRPEQGLEPRRREYVYTKLTRIVETAPSKDEQRIKRLQVIGALCHTDLAYLSSHLLRRGIQLRASSHGFRIDDSSALTLRQDNHGD